MSDASLARAVPVEFAAATARTRSRAQSALAGAWPIAAIGLVVVIGWYALSIHYNWPQAQAKLAPHASIWDHVGGALSQPEPFVPAPHQVAQNLYDGLARSPDDPRALWVHVGTTAAETALGLLFGALLGLLIATIFVHLRIVERALLPWVVASQTIPVLALAPIVISLFGTQLEGKVVVTTYLVFFAITVSAFKGLKSADALAHELMRSYAANPWQVYWKLRFPAALPYVFTGLKVGAAAALVGAIVAELFGSNYGLGVKILFATYYNQTIIWWSSMLAGCLVGLAAYLLISVLERLMVRSRPRV